jgi:hypothetical protein
MTRHRHQYNVRVRWIHTRSKQRQTEAEKEPTEALGNPTTIRYPTQTRIHPEPKATTKQSENTRKTDEKSTVRGRKAPREIASQPATPTTRHSSTNCCTERSAMGLACGGDAMVAVYHEPFARKS